MNVTDGGRWLEALSLQGPLPPAGKSSRSLVRTSPAPCLLRLNQATRQDDCFCGSRRHWQRVGHGAPAVQMECQGKRALVMGGSWLGAYRPQWRGLCPLHTGQ